MHDLALVILGSMPEQAGFTEVDETDARRLLEACELALGGGKAGDVLPAIYRSRYGGPMRPWLDRIAAAIDAADLDPVDRAGMAGAFRVAAMVLEDGVMERQRSNRRA